MTNPIIETDIITVEKKLKVLHRALVLEDLISSMLGKLLGIDYKSSISLGTRSSSISLMQKVNLLIDISALGKPDRDKFQKFMEIRNQFLHNIEVDRFSICFDLNDGELRKALIKQYKNITKNDDEEIESFYERIFDALSTEVLQKAEAIIKIVMNKISRESEEALGRAIRQSLSYTVPHQIEKIFDTIRGKPKVDTKDIELLENKVQNIILAYQELTMESLNKIWQTDKENE